MTGEEQAALEVARQLADAGVPVFVAHPDPDGSTQSGRATGFILPKGWEKTSPNPAYVDAWKPGMAICAVMGRGLDLADVDPRNGGDVVKLTGLTPRIRGVANTPSGGTHLFVSSMGVRSRDDLLPGIDVKAGADGQGVGFAFIAPTVRKSKVTGELAAYTWQMAPDLGSLGDDAVAAAGSELARLVGSVRFTQPADGRDHSDAWTDPRIEQLLLEGVPPGHAQQPVLRDLVAQLNGQGLGRAAIRSIWWAVVAKTTITDISWPWAEADFDDMYESAVRKFGTRPPGAEDTPQGDHPGHSWTPIDLSAALDGTGPRPVLLAREDDARLLYNGKVHTISGESESLKTWLVLLACLTVINHGQHVVFIDYEDDASSIAPRLTALGATREAIVTYFHYVRPEEPFGRPAANALYDAIHAGVALVIIDGVTEAMASHGLDPNSNSDVAAFLTRLPRWFAAIGGVVVMIDHVTKNREGRGRYAIGAQHKLAGIDVAYTVDLVRPFGHGLHGIAKIYVGKDRPGRVREHSPSGHAGTLHLHSQSDGSVLGSIEPPKITAPDQEPAAFRPTILMQRVSEYVEANPGLSGRALIAAVKGKTDHKKLALELLITEGYVTAVRVGNARQHKSAQPYRDTPDGEPDET